MAYDVSNMANNTDPTLDWSNFRNGPVNIANYEADPDDKELGLVRAVTYQPAADGSAVGRPSSPPIYFNAQDEYTQEQWTKLHDARRGNGVGPVELG